MPAAWMSALSGLGGFLGGNNIMNQAGNDIRGMTQFNPFGASGGFGNFGFNGTQGSGELDPMTSFLRGQMGGGMSNLFGGGQFFNNNDFQSAFQNNDIAGAMGNANNALGQQMGNSAFGGLEGLFNQNSGLASFFGNQAMQGMQDLSGGTMDQLFQGGLGNIAQASDLNGQNGLVQQMLEAQRNLAQPHQEQQRNMFANNEFLSTAGATSGAGQRTNDFFDNVLRGDNQLVLNAGNLGLQAQQQLGQLGLGQIGAGSGLLGQNIQGFGQTIGAAQGFGQMAAQNEAQGFGQNLSALQQNQSAGQQRLQNAMGIFGLGENSFNNAFGLGMQGFGAINDQNNFMMQSILGLLNAESGRIGATGMHAQALGGLAQGQGGFMGGMFGGIGDALGGLF